MKEVIIVEESSVTARGYRHRTTVPSRVFQYLKLKDKDKLRWTVWSDETVTVRKAGLERRKASSKHDRARRSETLRNE